MSDNKPEPRFDSNIELVGGGYDQGVAESKALAHAQRKFGRRWFRKLPLIWRIESGYYNEDVDRWEITVSCHPCHDEKNRGVWVYHISPDGTKVLPGTPLVQTPWEWKPKPLGQVMFSFTERNIVSTPKFVAFIIGFSVLIAILMFDDDGFIFIIDDANLLFHEAGHLIFGLFGATMALYGGTLGQLVCPIISGVAFWRQKSWVSVSVALLWLFENFINIAGYMADARSQKLPLVGGGEHEWANILTRWGALQYDTTLATILRVMGWLGLFSALVWITYLWWQNKKAYAGH